MSTKGAAPKQSAPKAGKWGDLGPRVLSGIAMIADSLEAASRSLDEISEDTLNNLIQKIINIKLAENQLDESGLTVGDLQVIKDAFREVLISSYHSRPKYPNQEDTRKLEQNRTSKKSTGKKKASGRRRK